MPTLDPNDPAKVDLEQVKKMVDLFMEDALNDLMSGLRE